MQRSMHPQLLLHKVGVCTVLNRLLTHTLLLMCSRRALAIYPVVLLYASIGWLGLVKAR